MQTSMLSRIPTKVIHVEGWCILDASIMQRERASSLDALHSEPIPMMIDHAEMSSCQGRNPIEGLQWWHCCPLTWNSWWVCENQIITN